MAGGSKGSREASFGSPETTPSTGTPTGEDQPEQWSAEELALEIKTRPSPEAMREWAARRETQPAASPEVVPAAVPATCPQLPKGVRLIRYQAHQPPVRLDLYSIVFDTGRFIEAELRELDSRLHNPVQIRGGHGVFMILERLRQVGLELTIEPVEARRDEAR